LVSLADNVVDFALAKIGGSAQLMLCWFGRLARDYETATNFGRIPAPRQLVLAVDVDGGLVDAPR